MQDVAWSLVTASLIPGASGGYAFLSPLVLSSMSSRLSYVSDVCQR